MKRSAPTSRNLFWVWMALMALLFLTWLAAEMDLGRWNVFAAMTIAVAKMLLVVLVFMHARYGRRLTWIVASAGFFWLFLMIALTLGDYLTRAGVWR